MRLPLYWTFVERAMKMISWNVLESRKAIFMKTKSSRHIHELH